MSIINEKYIYIMLSHTGTKFSKLLKVCTRNEFTHVSISLNSDLTQLYSFGRRNLYLPFIAGLIKENTTEGVYVTHDTDCIVYKVPVTDEEYKTIKFLISEFMKQYSEYKYNFCGLLFMAMGIPTSFKHHFVCSQFVAYLLSKGGVCNWNKDYSLIKPIDFLEVNNKQAIFKGKLKDYGRISTEVA